MLRNRVRSYFRSQEDLGPKVRAMVARVADFEYIVTRSEKEALLLESNLLKEHRPRYNVKLRDDKQYLYLKVATGTRFPRVYTTRRVAQDGARYFGPYTNAQALRQTIKQLQRLFQFRTCTLDMEKEYRRPCLLFHIKRCTGPCIRQVTEEDYGEAIRHLILFLEGKHDEVLDGLRREMMDAAEAAQLRARRRAAGSHRGPPRRWPSSSASPPSGGGTWTPSPPPPRTARWRCRSSPCATTRSSTGRSSSSRTRTGPPRRR